MVPFKQCLAKKPNIHFSTEDITDLSPFTVIGGVIGGIAGVSIVIALVCLFLRHRHRSKKEDTPTTGVFPKAELSAESKSMTMAPAAAELNAPSQQVDIHEMSTNTRQFAELQ